MGWPIDTGTTHQGLSVTKPTQRLPLLCALAGAIVFNVAGYVLESRTPMSMAFAGTAGLVVGYLAGLAIARSRNRA